MKSFKILPFIVGQFLIFFSLHSFASDSYKGLYTYITNPRMQEQNPRYQGEYQDAINNPAISGIAIIDRWKDLETSPGVFEWEKLDRWFAKAIELDKNLSIGISGGYNAPDWLTTQFNFPYVDLAWDKNRGQGNNDSSDCHYKDFVYPWHAGYKSRYLKMMKALRNHLANFKIEGSNRTALSYVKIVKVSGINEATNEFMIPTSAEAGDYPCSLTPEIPNNQKWLSAGFTPQKIVAAFDKIAEELAILFPARKLAVDVIGKFNAFPNYDNNGNIIPKDGFFDPITLAVIENGVTKYGSRFHVQHDALSNLPRPFYLELMDVTLPRGRLGYQLNQAAGFGTGCGGDLHLCVVDPANGIDEFSEVIQNGLNLGAEYLEVHTFDADRLGGNLIDPF